MSGKYEQLNTSGPIKYQRDLKSFSSRYYFIHRGRMYVLIEKINMSLPNQKQYAILSLQYGNRDLLYGRSNKYYYGDKSEIVYVSNERPETHEHFDLLEEFFTSKSDIINYYFKKKFENIID